MSTLRQTDLDLGRSDARLSAMHRPWLPGGAPCRRRLIVSVVAGAVYSTLRWFVPDGLVTTDVNSSAHPSVAVALLVLLAAFQVVELVALAWPPLRWRRVGGPDGRVVLNRASVVLALTAGFLWPVLIDPTHLAGLGPGIDDPGGLAVLFAPSRLVLAALQVLLVALVVTLGVLVTRYGIGNGFSLLVALEALGMIVSRGASVATSASPSGAGGVWTGLVFGLVALGYLLMKTLRWSDRRFGAGPCGSGEASAPPLSGSWCPMAGVVALQLSSLVLWVPATIANLGFEHGAAWARAIVPGTAGYALAHVAATLIGAVIGSWLFYRPALVVRLAAGERGGTTPGDLSHLNRSFGVALGVTLGFYSGCLLLQHVLAGATAVELPLVACLLVDAIAADLWLEWRARAAGPLVKVWELHQPYALAAAHQVLGSCTTRFHLRAVNHRVLGLFFAPYVPVDILVDEASANEAAQVLGRRFGCAVRRGGESLGTTRRRRRGRAGRGTGARARLLAADDRGLDRHRR